MYAVEIKNATRHRVGAQQGYIGIAIRDDFVEGVPVMVTAWRPMPDEVARIAAGEPVILRIMGIVPPPVMLTVGDDGGQDNG